MGIKSGLTNALLYGVTHRLRDLGWVDFDLVVASSCPAAQPLLPNSYQPKQNWADIGTTKVKVNPTQVFEQKNRPVNVTQGEEENNMTFN